MAITRLGILLIVAAMICASCKATKKSGRTKGCDCPRWSKAETELTAHGQEKV